MGIINVNLCGNQHVTKSVEIKSLLADNREILLNGETNNGICYDGIIDEKAYKKSPIKVMVLLKETNGNDKNGKHREKQKDWNYLHWLKHQQVNNEPLQEVDEHGNIIKNETVFYASTFKKLCQWLTILFDIAENKEVFVGDYFVDGRMDIANIRKSLNQVAIVNLKKSWGYEKTDFQKLYDYATNDKIKPIILEEIKIANPKIVLCCSPDVYYIASKINGVGDNDHIKLKSKVFNNKTNEMFVVGNTIYVSFYHPQGYLHTEIDFARYAVEVFNWVFENKKKLGI